MAPKAPTQENEAIAHLVRTTAEQHRGDTLALLGLLRLLESLHREIRDSYFQDTLPKNRQDLYSLLRDIEAEGGWPYISRMRLKEILVYLLEEEQSSNNNIQS
ncbi:hypothetical protein ACQ4M4_21210 [Leptolyngbya sp. AN02str]|uniref:hypothetical protein n=1 Tax=Leptolyngbya sp. AN02str TaxID=3423363 RepID=UPI003D31F6F4